MMTEQHHQQQQSSSSSSNAIAKTLRGGGVLVRARRQKTTSASGNGWRLERRDPRRRETTTTRKRKRGAGEKRRKQRSNAGAETHSSVRDADDGIPTRTRTAVDGGRFSVRFAQLERGDESRRGEGVRCRQHVNPLSQKFCKPSETPSWDVIFKDISKPLTIDVGCGGGDSRWRWPNGLAREIS